MKPLFETKFKDIYYNVEDDLKRAPNAWCYIIIGGRKRGKTYSTLKTSVKNDKIFAFVKRTQDDITRLCIKAKEVNGVTAKIDTSPFKAINRDTGWNIQPMQFSKEDGIGAFWQWEDNAPVGSPLGYALALSGTGKYTGIDISETDYMIFDEFIPRPWERVSKDEGDQVMELYVTIGRDREERGKEPLKLIALANARTVNNGLMQELEIVDEVVDMKAKGEEFRYLENRGIFIHNVKDRKGFAEAESKTAIYQGMKNTRWGQMAFQNEFSYNDFTAVKEVSVKRMRPLIDLIYKNKHIYIYQNEVKGNFYMCSRLAKCPYKYNLDLENDYKLFYADYAIDLRNETIAGFMHYEKYTYYDLIVNYTKYFKM